MKLNYICLVFLLIYFSSIVESASILALFSSLSHSDHLVFRGYISRIAKKGHSVVVMTPYPGHFEHSEVGKIVELDVGEASAKYWEEYKKLVTNTNDHFTKMREFNELLIKIAAAQLKSLQMMSLLTDSRLKFDLVITEADVPILYAVAEKYKAPHVAITASTGRIHQYESKGNPVHPFSFPDVNTLNYRHLSIWQKLVELYRHVQTKREYYNYFMPLCQVAAEKILGFRGDLQQVEYNIDMLLVAGNPLLIGNRPSVPGVAYADGMHIKEGNVLPQNLQNILDSATEGAIYFSLGSIQESEDLSPKILQAITDVFRDLPYTVLWKIGNVTAINKPDNVFAHAWFPQQEVLAHPNIKAFITHGGLRSLEEALFYEVPIIGFPTVKPRKVFIRELTRYGVGEILDPYYINKDLWKNKIVAVASDAKYKEAVTRLRLLMDDPIISGPESAIWWTEYVLQYGGAKHLRSPVLDHGFAEYYMLDVFGVCVLVFFIVMLALYNLVRCILKRCRRRNSLSNESCRKFKAL